MNIVVCVKYVPDAQAERTFNASDNTTDRENVDGLLSELDEYAVEEALKIVEAGEGEVTVLTVGPDAAADAIKKALQMGAHKGVHVKRRRHPRLRRHRDLARARRGHQEDRATSTSSSPAWPRPTAPWASSPRCSPSASACRP